MLQNDFNENENPQMEEKEKCIICRNLFSKVELKQHQIICMNTLSNQDQEYLDEQLAQLFIDQNFQSTIFSTHKVEEIQLQNIINSPSQLEQNDEQQIKNQESNDLSEKYLQSKISNENRIDKDELEIQFSQNLQLDDFFKEQKQSGMIQQQQQEQEDLQKNNTEQKINEKIIINDFKILNEKEQKLNNEQKEQQQFDFQQNLQDPSPQIQVKIKQFPQNLEIKQNLNQFDNKDHLIKQSYNSQRKNIKNIDDEIDIQNNQFLNQQFKVAQQQVNLKEDKKNIEKKNEKEKKQLPFSNNFLRYRPQQQPQIKIMQFKREGQIPQIPQIPQRPQIPQIPQNQNMFPINFNQGQLKFQQQQQTNVQQQRLIQQQHPIEQKHELQQQQQKQKFEFKPGMRLTDEQVNKLSQEDIYEYFTQVDLEEQVGFQSKIFQLVKKKVQINETGRCSICLDDIQPSKEAVDIQLDCKHQFHYDCIKQWLQLQKKCPVCKGSVDLCLK